MFNFFKNKNKKTEAFKESAFEEKTTVDKDKYKIKELDEEEIIFKDFGFKLCIIEDLMYVKELLKPKFDLVEFVDWYEKRDIDLNEEGYEPISEVTEYFKALPIPLSLAKEVSEIYQDGGNEIYSKLVYYFDGEEDYWEIKEASDIKYFPNLKSVTLCYATDEAFQEFSEAGIETEWL